VKTFILAGHETSASMLAWSLYELTQSPELLSRVKAEGAKVWGKHLTRDSDGEVQPSSMPTRDEIDQVSFDSV
jgi:cytochrome P450